MSFFSRKRRPSPSSQSPAPTTAPPSNSVGSRPAYPWSAQKLQLQPPAFVSRPAVVTPGPSPSPFPRYGHSLSPVSAASGEVFLFGGLVRELVRNDLYSFSIDDLSATLIETAGEIPPPRVGHASTIIGSVLIVWGGDTKFNGSDKQDQGLYLLNLGTLEWTRVSTVGSAPLGRYGHAVAMVARRFFVFGGQVDGEFLCDLWAFDLSSLKSNPQWELFTPAAGSDIPARRTGHVCITHGDKIYLFGGTDGQYHYNDTWSFDVASRTWKEIACIGFLPVPREGHAAALVDDVMYVFGGRGVDGKDLDDLGAFRISNSRWYKFINMGPSPSGRSGHAMASHGSKVIVLGGEPFTSSEPDDPSIIHVFDTRHIKYPGAPRPSFALSNQGTIPSNTNTPRPTSPYQRPPNPTPTSTQRNPPPTSSRIVSPPNLAKEAELEATLLVSRSDEQTVRIWKDSSKVINPQGAIPTSDLAGLAQSVNDSQPNMTASAPTSIPLNDNIAESLSIDISTASSQQDTFAPAPEPFELNNDITGSISLESTTLIGYGGFGELFLGTHTDHGKVALKKPRRLLDEALIRRFLREVDLWCSVSHQYILPCLGMCRVGPDVYVVSPFIENGDLLSCMTRGKDLNRSKLLFEVAEALTHLHHRGIVHGDVKAQNILLADDGSALLCDFGLAKAFDTMATSTEVKGAGSVRWMSPELFRGESRSMASDVYALGITIAEVRSAQARRYLTSCPFLWQVLSGRAPYQDISDTLAVMFHIVYEDGRPPKEPLTSPEGKSYATLWETAEKCWVKDVKARPYMAQVLGMLFPLTRERA